MLKENKATGAQDARKYRFAIVASKYNARFVDGMVEAARRGLEKANAAEVKVVRVPGAFEIPVIVAALMKSRWSAIICLGVIVRGETAHAQLIGEGVTYALAQMQVQHRVPIIHEVLLLENEAQAEARCLNPKHNRGVEAALTALEMANIVGGLGKKARKDARPPGAPKRS